MATAQTATVPLASRAPSTRRVALWRTPRTRALLLVAAIAAPLGIASLGLSVYADLLWFHEVGHDRVFWTTLTWRVAAPAVAGLGTACFVLLNLWVVERRTPATRWRLRRPAHRLAAIACGAVSVHVQPDGTWKALLLWVHGSDFGSTDPLFHRDVGFFVFSLPFYDRVADWLLLTVLMAGATAAAAYVAAGGLRAARSHALWLAALLLLVLAWRVRLDQLAYALPHGGAVASGASYTDVHVRLPALRVLTDMLLAGAVLCAGCALRLVSGTALAVLAVLAALAATAASGLPSLVERFDVAPQALSRERPQLEDAIAGTREAFALDRVSERPLPANRDLSPRLIAEHRSTVDNVPLWDSSVLRPALNELQAIGAYYGFPSVTTDRYTVGGKTRVMTVAARQLDLGGLRPRARTWANEHFAYTHGYGVVAVRGGEADRDRYPRFAQGEFGSRDTPLPLAQPRIYYGQTTTAAPEYVIVDSGRAEVDAPIPGSRPPVYHHDGGGGIPLSNPLRRLAFAVRFGDTKLLLTETATARSRILIHRDVGARLRTLAPFLSWDRHPQTVVAGGRVHYLVHGYTTSSHYPYSAPLGGGRGDVNYLRASALATVDAFSGETTLYAAGGDPVLRAWQAAYAGLFRPLSELPQGLREHLRYPRRLFAAQAEAYATYHAHNATGFWNGADAWQESSQLAGAAEDAGEIHFPDPTPGRMRPAYLLARLAGDQRERFMLATTFTPRGRQNLVGYLAGSVDEGGRLQLTLLSTPRDRLTMGPTQVTREVLASPAVNRQIQLLNRESTDLGQNSVNRTILGVPRVLPLGGALLQVQPIYVTAGGSGLPRLQLVTAHANGHVGYGRDLPAALRRLVRDASRGAAEATP